MGNICGTPVREKNPDDSFVSNGGGIPERRSVKKAKEGVPEDAGLPQSKMMFEDKKNEKQFSTDVFNEADGTNRTAVTSGVQDNGQTESINENVKAEEEAAAAKAALLLAEAEKKEKEEADRLKKEKEAEEKKIQKEAQEHEDRIRKEMEEIEAAEAKKEEEQMAAAMAAMIDENEAKEAEIAEEARIAEEAAKEKAATEQARIAEEAAKEKAAAEAQEEEERQKQIAIEHEKEQQRIQAEQQEQEAGQEYEKTAQEPEESKIETAMATDEIKADLGAILAQGMNLEVPNDKSAKKRSSSVAMSKTQKNKLRKKKTQIVKQIKDHVLEAEGITEEICAGFAKDWIELHAQFFDDHDGSVDEYEFELFASKLDEDATKESIKDTFFKCSAGGDELNQEQLGEAIHVILQNTI